MLMLPAATNLKDKNIFYLLNKGKPRKIWGSSNFNKIAQEFIKVWETWQLNSS